MESSLLRGFSCCTAGLVNSLPLPTAHALLLASGHCPSRSPVALHSQHTRAVQGEDNTVVVLTVSYENQPMAPQMPGPGIRGWFSLKGTLKII